jgi:hypothetical protein
MVYCLAGNRATHPSFKSRQQTVSRNIIAACFDLTIVRFPVQWLLGQRRILNIQHWLLFIGASLRSAFEPRRHKGTKNTKKQSTLMFNLPAGRQGLL